ncbi:MAG: hypothetical protein ACLUD2_15165 [Clostridium sp.]
MESKRSKYILIGLSVFCILLIGITSFKDGFLNPLRSGVGYVLNPIQSGVNRVGTSLYNGISNYSTLHSAMAEKQAPSGAHRCPGGGEQPSSVGTVRTAAPAGAL